MQKQPEHLQARQDDHGWKTHKQQEEQKWAVQLSVRELPKKSCFRMAWPHRVPWLQKLPQPWQPQLQQPQPRWEEEPHLRSTPNLACRLPATTSKCQSTTFEGRQEPRGEGGGVESSIISLVRKCSTTYSFPASRTFGVVRVIFETERVVINVFCPGFLGIHSGGGSSGSLGRQWQQYRVPDTARY